MAIIRNERAQRPDPEPQVETKPEEIEIDYRWHPTEDEFVSPLTAEQWSDLLADSTFAETDAAKAVRCLRDYGEPATFQQLSIRYRGTMGRYRRWLNEAAQMAGERYGVPAPQKDQFGMDEWWPLLYLMRATGKPGANVFEMTLRPEVEEAFGLIDEQEKQAKRAENARQLQRIEQLERARREERERRAAQAAKATQETHVVEATPAEPEIAPEPAVTVVPTPTRPMVRTVAQVAGTNQDAKTTTPAPAVATPSDQPAPAFPAVNEFLSVMSSGAQGSAHPINKGKDIQAVPFDAAGPLDYALRYAERLRNVLALMREGHPWISAAAVARVVGDKTVEHLQSILNGQEIPTFEYLDTLKNRLFINPEYLEATEGVEGSVPVFCTYQELLNEQGLAADLAQNGTPQEIAYVVDDASERRTGMIVRFSALCCVLLTRDAVNADFNGVKNPQLQAFVRMVDELDTYAQSAGIARTSHTVSAAEWDELASGRIWPGTLL